MRLIVYVHYFLSCLFGCKHLPRIIEYGGEEWFSVCGYDKDGWFVAYSRHIEKFVTEDLVKVQSRYKYVVCIKMMCQLWKMRKTVNFGIEYE